MTTLENRPNTALLVVDVQNDVVARAHDRDAVVANVGSLVEKARRERIPVVWVQHSDEGLVRESDDWRIVPDLSRDENEPLVEKSYGDSFEDTTLESVLSDLGVGASSSSARRPTRASARRSTARSRGATRRPWSATPTRRRTSRNGARRRRNR
jgi:hypothetical protein